MNRNELIEIAKVMLLVVLALLLLMLIFGLLGYIVAQYI